MWPSVRKAAHAGSWYPGDATTLRSELEFHLSNSAGASLEGRLVGLVCPHAGLIYSGPVAAYGFRLLRRRTRATVALLGPSHRGVFDGVAVYDRGGWGTPLGTTPIDQELAARVLAQGRPFFVGLEEHRFEHSLEMQLPFLQHLIPDLRIVPMLMGWQTAATILGAAAGLAAACASSDDVFLLASSDLSHYHEAGLARELDQRIIDDVAGFDCDRLLARIERTPEHACGGGPMVAVLRAARALGADRSSVLHYGHSGEVGERDVSRVVGYLSAALWKAA